MTNSKEKMSSEEAWENLNYGVKFAKHLDQSRPQKFGQSDKW